mmetsp:Transcript_4207/g.9839  ORF Transcript_4207/g.9839 Transcript_4207/m.9839 type:complete len:250 (+) Transcript_4207:607-1356(+)
MKGERPPPACHAVRSSRLALLSCHTRLCGDAAEGISEDSRSLRAQLGGSWLVASTKAPDLLQRFGQRDHLSRGLGQVMYLPHSNLLCDDPHLDHGEAARKSRFVVEIPGNEKRKCSSASGSDSLSCHRGRRQARQSKHHFLVLSSHDTVFVGQKKHPNPDTFAEEKAQQLCPPSSRLCRIQSQQIDQTQKQIDQEKSLGPAIKADPHGSTPRQELYTQEPPLESTYQRSHDVHVVVQQPEHRVENTKGS